MPNFGGIVQIITTAAEKLAIEILNAILANATTSEGHVDATKLRSAVDELQSRHHGR